MRDKSIDNLAIERSDIDFFSSAAFSTNLDKKYMVNEDGNTLIFSAIFYLNFEIVKRFIELGFDVNHKNRWGETPIFQAASIRGGHKMIELLIEHGADPDVVNKSGRTCAQTSIRRCEVKNFTTLLKYIKNTDGIESTAYRSDLEVFSKEFKAYIENAEAQSSDDRERALSLY